MNEIRIFDNPDFGEVRTVMIDGEPWFVGKDVAAALGYSRERDAISTHVDEDDAVKYGVMDSMGREQQTTVINESGVYSLIFGSKLSSAKKFKRWVTSEVLPQLRKTGGYGLALTTEQQIQLLAQGNVELNRKVDTLSDRMDKMEMDLPILPVEADRITSAVQKKGVSVLGGKQSPAYRNTCIRSNVYNKLHANLRWNFGIKTYKSLRRNQCDKAIEVINKWEPPVFLSELIENINNQEEG